MHYSLLVLTTTLAVSATLRAAPPSTQTSVLRPDDRIVRGIEEGTGNRFCPTGLRLREGRNTNRNMNGTAMKPILTLLLLTVLLLAPLGVLPNSSTAEPAPDPRTTVLPIYTLPAGAAADGKLAEWAGVPPVPAERFNIGPFNSNPDPAKRPAPDNFAPTLRCGMKPGSPDLYFLIVVRDSQRYTEPKASWVEGDRVEMFLDFGRQARDEQQPDWRKESQSVRQPARHGPVRVGAADAGVRRGGAHRVRRRQVEVRLRLRAGRGRHRLRAAARRAERARLARRQGAARTRRLRADHRRPGLPAGAAHRGLEQRRLSRRR